VCAREAQHAARRSISVAVLTLGPVSPRWASVATALATAKAASGCDPQSLDYYTWAVRRRWNVLRTRRITHFTRPRPSLSERPTALSGRVAGTCGLRRLRHEPVYFCSVSSATKRVAAPGRTRNCRVQEPYPSLRTSSTCSPSGRLSLSRGVVRPAHRQLARLREGP